MEYINNTKLSFDEFASLLLKMSSNRRKMIISASSSLILLLIVILNWDSNSLIAYILMSGLIVIGFTLSLLVLFLEKWMIKKTNKQFENGVEYIYTFKENEVVVTSVINSEKKSFTFSYQSLSKVVISEDNIYLYPTSVSVYCVSLAGFSNEEEKNAVKNMLSTYQKKK